MVLDGCKTDPLSSYLKSLGLLRVLSRNDPETTARWQNSRFVIDCGMDADAITDHLLNRYEPSPIIGPWSYSKYEDKTRPLLLSIIASDKDRFAVYQKTLDRMDDVMSKFATIIKKPKKKIIKTDVDQHKLLLLKMCRNNLPDDAIPWIDATFVIAQDKHRPSPILFSGGNDGNFDMTENFVKNIHDMIVDENARERSIDLLTESLCGDISSLYAMKAPGHTPRGGPNFGNGFDGKSLSNPWEYILMMEGVILFAGGLTKRQSATSGKASFPFTSGASNVGYHTAVAEETDGGQQPPSKGEIWIPVWERPTSYNEIHHMFGEGRVQLNGRSARTGTEFARAIISMGVDRGISEFQRFCMLKRKGKAYITIPAGTLRVVNEAGANLLNEMDKWLEEINKAVNEKPPASLIRLKRALDDSVMRYCTNRKNSDLMQVLIRMGKLERYVSGQKDFVPIQSLKKEWLARCYDGSAEFRLAASVASIRRFGGVEMIRANLENVEMNDYGSWRHKKDSISCVWKKDDTLLRNMERVLHRRILEGQMQACDVMPNNGTIPSVLSDIVRFLNGDLDENKIRDLILPLSFIDMGNVDKYPWSKNAPDTNANIHLLLPEAYSIIKLVHPAKKSEGIPYNMSVVNLLRAGRHPEAYNRAACLLKSHRMVPLLVGNRSGSGNTATMSDTVKKYILASLLFPISKADRADILERVIAKKVPNS